jgi:hypothetical protein
LAVLHRGAGLRKSATWVERQHREAESRALGLERSIASWLERYASNALKEQRGAIAEALRERNPRVVTVSKASQGDLSEQLVNMLRRFTRSSFSDGAKSTGLRRAPPGVFEEFESQIATKVKLLRRETELRIRKAIREIITEALASDVVPSVGEVGRRISRQFFGPGQQTDVYPGRGTAEERRVTIDWRKANPEPEYIVSPKRARIIARNEMQNARMAGIATGYEATGIKYVEWLSKQNDGRSGERKHYLMNDHPPIAVADMRGSDESKWFKLPSGVHTPHPRHPSLPAKEAINCRCGIIPSRRRR